MKYFIFLISIMGFLTISKAQNVNNTLRDTLFYPNQTCANVWGYVDSLGNEYALVGASKGMCIVNVTNPDSIWQVKRIPGPDNEWKEIRTYGHYAYCTSEGGSGLQIINLSNLPDTNLQYHFWQPIVNGLTLTKIHALHIDTATGYIYLYGCHSGFEGTMIAKLTNPYIPTYRGKYGSSNNYVHDGIVRNNMMYASQIYAGDVTFIDVSIDSVPTPLGIQHTPGAFTHNTWLSDDNKYLFTTDEISNSFLTCYNIENLQNVEYVDKIQSNPGSNSIVHNTYYKNGYCFTSWYRDGYTIVDASRPNNLIQVGDYDTFSGSGSGFNGAWGVYGYLPSGNVLITNIDTSTATSVGALTVVTPNLMRGCYLEGMVTDSITNFPISNVQITATEIPTGTGVTIISDSTLLNGNYAMGTVHSGLYSVTYSKMLYQTQTFQNVSLQNGVLKNINVKLLADSLVGLNEIVLGKSPFHTTYNNKTLMIECSLPQPKYSFQLFETNGKLVYESTHSKNIETVDLNKLSAGIYIAKFITIQGSVSNKFVLN